MPFVRESHRLFFPHDLNELVQMQIENAHSEVLRKDAEELLGKPVNDQAILSLPTSDSYCPG
jgi:hypothetical protein